MAELKWLEDLVALMEADSLTEAAQLRHVTQPAFSRRIRLLEHWLGLELIDRNRKPVHILPAIREHEAEVRELVRRFYQLRNQLQDSSRQQRTLFVSQHTLAISHFPQLLQQLQQQLPHSAYRLQTANNEACPLLFAREAHFMLCYEQAGKPLLDETDAVKRQVLEYEHLLPVATAEHNVRSPLTAGQESILPMLMFPPGSFFADVLGGTLLPRLMREYRLDIICESALAVSLRQMALAGTGIAWLPEGLVRDDLAAGRLQRLEWLEACDLQVSLYRKL